MSAASNGGDVPSTPSVLCHHARVSERPRYAIDDPPGHYLCLDCGDTFPLIGDTDAWEPKAGPLQRDPLNLDGWCVAICSGCGAQIAEWLDEDGGPGHVEHEVCPMCDEADRVEELDGF